MKFIALLFPSVRRLIDQSAVLVDQHEALETVLAREKHENLHWQERLKLAVDGLDEMRAKRDALQVYAEKADALAAEGQRNTDYYRSLVIQCGTRLGPEAFTADGGTVMQDVLCAKVPAMVHKLIDERDAFKLYEEAVKEHLGNLPDWDASQCHCNDNPLCSYCKKGDFDPRTI